MENEKLIKSANIIDRCLKIFRGFALAGVIVSAIFIPLTLIFGTKVIADASHLELGNLTLKMAGDFSGYLDLEAVKKSILISLVCSVAACGAAWYCLRLLRGILAPMKEGRPFEAGIADRIRTLGWAVLIGGGVSECGKALADVCMVKAYDLSFLSAAPHVEGVTFNYSIDLWFVWTALLVFFLSYVFRCGERLQQESDETL